MRKITNEILSLGPVRYEGRVTGISARGLQLSGLGRYLAIGDRVSISRPENDEMQAEVTAINEHSAQALTYFTQADMETQLIVSRRGNQIDGLPVCDGWLGRVIDPLGRPLDEMNELAAGSQRQRLRRAAPAATTRGPLGSQLDFGVRALNLFTPCRQGQRLGLFASSGVGKSTLLAMLARNTVSDVVVLALVGERGREVRNFLMDEIGINGLARAVVVVATSDEPALMRREAAYAAMAISEYFRDRGQHVLLLVDSITRFCQALREIALASGEPPATRGYPASVFAELPRLLERAGPAAAGNAGLISAIFTVLVEGDDHNEPVSDAVRGILDGHVVLDRRIGERGRYPAIDVLRSLSRTTSECQTAEQAAMICRARKILTIYGDLADLVRLGAYRPGYDADADEAMSIFPALEEVLRQTPDSQHSILDSFVALGSALGVKLA